MDLSRFFCVTHQALTIHLQIARVSVVLYIASKVTWTLCTVGWKEN